jgi:hypothetical protein
MSEYPDWIDLYRAALQETDPDKLVRRIEEAERAMKQGLRVAVESGDSDQRHRIAEGLHQLEMIRRGRKGNVKQ